LCDKRASLMTHSTTPAEDDGQQSHARDAALSFRVAQAGVFEGASQTLAHRPLRQSRDDSRRFRACSEAEVRDAAGGSSHGVPIGPSSGGRAVVGVPLAPWMLNAGSAGS
jgi:hypothetical protein